MTRLETLLGSPTVVVGVVIAAAALVIVAVVLAARSGVQLHRARNDRLELAVVPTSEFDPDPESVLRFASQLLRTRRATGVAVPDGAHAVRLSLCSMGEGRMVQLLSGPSRAASILRQPGYSQVELVDRDRLAARLAGTDPADPTGQGGHAAAGGAALDGDRTPPSAHTPPGASTPLGHTTPGGEHTPPGRGRHDEPVRQGWRLLDDEESHDAS